MPLLIAAIRVYWVVILLRCIFSWLPAQYRSGDLYAFLFRLTEPVLAPVRRLLPSAGGMDFSPMIVLILLGVVARSLPPI